MMGIRIRSSSSGLLSLLAATFLVVVIPATQALWMNLPISGTKCVSEEIQHKVVVVGDFAVLNVDGHMNVTVSVKVTSPFGSELYHTENVTHGQFAFTSTEIGPHQACFTIDGSNDGGAASLSLDWKTGVDAKDWEAVAKKENIQGVELELRKLDDIVESIHDNLIYLKQREIDMRDVSEKTNRRVAVFSIMSLASCILVSTLQVLYLKHYFRKKKLI